MACSEAQRTLVKSPPELWAELSSPDSLARHLGDFGEIRITRVEPETTVEWEAQDVRGTVQLDSSGWGTKVMLSVVREAPEPPAAPEPEPEPEVVSGPEPEAVSEPEPEARPKLLARIFQRLRRRWPAAEPEPEPEPDPEPVLAEEQPAQARPPDLAVELARIEAEITQQDTALLAAVLDRLGAAHHRPFSRA